MDVCSLMPASRVPSQGALLFPDFVLSILVVRCPAESDVYSRISAEASAAIEQSGVPSVSLAIVQDGKIWAKAFGKADLKEDRAADITTRYAVGSVSKQFTAAAILLLCEQSKLSLNDPVAKYFPDLTRAGEITIASCSRTRRAMRIMRRKTI